MATQTSAHEALLDLYDKYSSCKACNLNRYRRQGIRAIGNMENPLVLFVLDRFDPPDLTRAQILQGAQYEVLKTILSFLEKDIREYYYTGVIACPPRYLHTIEDLVPLPKVQEAKACRERVLTEIGLLQPQVVVACGQSAAKCALPTKTPRVDRAAGSMFPMLVPGAHVHYPVPVMLTNSLHTLGKLPPDEQPELWHQTCEHIHSAITVAEQLNQLQGE